MQKTLLFLALICCFGSTTKAQNQPYIPMAIDSAYWLVEETYVPVDAPPIPVYSYYLYGTNGDTTLNNVTYKKAFYYQIDSTGDLQGTLIALLRDDTATRQVYMINLSGPGMYHGCAFQCQTSNEFLLYDFALNTTADTLHNCNTIDFSYAVAHDTTYRLVYGQTRKVIETGSPSATSFEWYEGIGGQTSPFSRFANGYLGGLPNYSLYDYCVGEIKTCSSWGIFSSNTDVEQPLGLKVFPNPAKNILNIELETFQEVEVSVFNALGQWMKTEQLSASTTNISLENYTNGLYYLRFTKDGQLLKTEKFLIVK